MKRIGDTKRGTSNFQMRHFTIAKAIVVGVIFLLFANKAQAQSSCYDAVTKMQVAPCPLTLSATPIGTSNVYALLVVNNSNQTRSFTVQCSYNSTYFSVCSAGALSTTLPPLGYTTVLVFYTAANNLATNAMFSLIVTSGGRQVQANIYTDIVPIPVAVTPDDSALTVSPTSAGRAKFVIATTAHGQGLYTIEPVCSGAISDCGDSYSLQLENSASTAVEIPYESSSSGSTGAIKLRVTSIWNSMVTDSAAYITAARHSSGVWVSPATSHVSTGVGTSASATFNVTNNGTGSTTYTLTAGCSNQEALASCNAPTDVTVAGGVTVPVNVTYSTTSIAGASGDLTLTASTGGLSSSGTTRVMLENGSGLAVDIASINSGSVVARDLCITAAMAGGGAYECGDLRLVHPLSTINTRGKSRTPTLLYNSQHAYPYPLVAANVHVVTVPDQVTASLMVENTIRATETWSGSDWAANSTRRITLGFAAIYDNTGAYPYTLTVTSTKNGVPTSVVLSDTLIVVNRHTSHFGSGWWLAGLEKLERMTSLNRLLWIGGDGSARLYTPVTSGVYTATQLDRPDTIKVVGSKFIRYAEHGVRIEYDTVFGRHLRTINRLEDTTSFAYDPSSGALTGITVPPTAAAASYSFTYAHSNGKLSSAALTAPEGTRTTTIGNPTGTVVSSIADPDGGTVTFDYVPGTSWVRAKTNRRGHASYYRYYPIGGKLLVDSVPLGGAAAPVVTMYTPYEIKGTRWDNAAPLSHVYTGLVSPRTDMYALTRFRVNKYGAPSVIVNARGDSVVLRREDSRFPALVTSLRAENGFTTLAQYDARGNMVQSTQVNPFGDGLNPTVRYGWDPQWDFVTRVVQPLGDSIVMQYDAITGNRLWQQDGRGASSRVAFRYYNGVSSSVDGLLKAVETPMGIEDSVAYTTFGNVGSMWTPSGIKTTYAYDGFGRRIETRIPVNSLQTEFQRDSVVYDVMDRVVQTVAIGGSQRATVNHFFDAEGNDTTVHRVSSPDVANIGTLITKSRYDALGRLVRAVSVGGAVDSTEYNEISLPVKTISRLADTVVFVYDTLGRLARRTSSGKLIPIVSETTGDFPRFANYPDPTASWGNTDHLIPADTATFSYDVRGNLVRAENNAAVILRSYSLGGAMVTDTQVVRTYSYDPSVWGDTTAHRYGFAIQYDQNGRRIAVKNPSDLATSPNTITWLSYSPYSGHLQSIHDFRGYTYSFFYDIDGRLVKTSYPGDVRDTTVYNLDGDFIHRVTYNTSARGPGYSNFSVLHNEVTTRDVRGKITAVATTGGVTPIDSVRAAYSTLGHLISTRRRQPYGWEYNGNSGIDWRADIENFVLDGMANIRASNTSVVDGMPFPDSMYRGILYSYQAPGVSGGTGRLIARLGVDDDEAYEYDAAGNQIRASTSNRVDIGEVNGVKLFYVVNGITRSYYDALGKLRLVDQQLRKASHTDNAWHYDEFLYDALGRLVLTRNRAFCTGVFHKAALYRAGGVGYVVTDSRCKNKIRRTVWDGDQIVWEIQYDGRSDLNTPEYDVGVDTTEYTGRVHYVHAGSIDRPVGVWRYDYKSGNNYVSPAPSLIIPHYNWKSVPIFPTFETGQVEKCDFTMTAQCVAVSWPGMTQSYERVPEMEVSWHGSLLDRSTQGSGLQYKRNRFYDPATGRFTQEDPIGLAGGLNAYGYANGDPINYSDPFGLCPVPASNCPPGFFTGLGAASGAVGGLAIAAVCTAGSGGICAFGAPAIVAGMTSLGTSVGVAGDAIAQKSDALTLEMSKIGNKIRSILTGILIGKGEGLSDEQEVVRRGGAKPATEQAEEERRKRKQEEERGQGSPP